MTKTKDTIEGLKKSKARVYCSCTFKDCVCFYEKRKNALSHAIQIAQAQEQAEGMLPEKKEIKVKELPHSVYDKCRIGNHYFEKGLCKGANQMHDIAQPILAKKILECEEKDKQIKAMHDNGLGESWVDRVAEKDKRIEELERKEYFREFEIIAGLNRHSQGLTFEQWKNKQL